MYAGSFEATLQLRGPVVSHSSAVGGYGIDTVMARTRDENGQERYYLAGTLIKGRLGEAWQELGRQDWRDDFLGLASPGGEEGGRNLPRRGTVFFGDFVDGKTATGASCTRFRVRIDEQMGSVQHGMVQVIESPWRSGEPVTFVGTVRVLAENGDKAAEVRGAVERGLNWIAAAGAEQSAGFGRLEKVHCGDLEERRPPATIIAGDAVEMAITPTEPFCLALRRIAKNMFGSSEVIPGGAVKGVVAEMLKLRGAEYSELSDNLYAIRFLHAFPAKLEKKRPEVLPLSLAIVPADKTRIYNAVHDWLAIEALEPAFDVDWKDQDRARVYAAFGLESADMELRVRTAIEGEARRAKDEDLFGYRMAVPHGFRWCGGVSFAGVPELKRGIVARQLQELLAMGLFGLGKTKAWAKVECAPTAGAVVRGRADGRIIVTLQTAALLLNPGRLGADVSMDAVKKEYETVWNLELGDGSVELEDLYFQRTALAGGGYFRHRFQHDLQYRPFLLTEAGSVFVLRVRNADVAAAKAKEWLIHGLPIPKGARSFYYLRDGEESTWWDHCPFVRENGYGEVSVNSALHDWASHDLKEDGDVRE
jgi:hypothetical protein